MRKIRVKPANEDIKIKDSTGKTIPVRGAEVDKTVEIIRHIREGALVVTKTLQKKKIEEE